MRPDYGRDQRLRHAIQETLADLLLRKTKDPRVRSVTVTDVRVSPDLRHAHIYVAVSRRSAGAQAQALEGVRSAVGYLRGELGRELGLRYAPELHVELDRTLDEAQRIETLISRLREADERAGRSWNGDEPGEAGPATTEAEDAAGD